LFIHAELAGVFVVNFLTGPHAQSCATNANIPQTGAFWRIFMGTFEVSEESSPHLYAAAMCSGENYVNISTLWRNLIVGKSSPEELAQGIKAFFPIQAVENFLLPLFKLDGIVEGDAGNGWRLGENYRNLKMVKFRTGTDQAHFARIKATAAAASLFGSEANANPTDSNCAFAISSGLSKARYRQLIDVVNSELDSIAEESVAGEESVMFEFAMVFNIKG
jgi:hypothetical protein